MTTYEMYAILISANLALLIVTIFFLREFYFLMIKPKQDEKLSKGRNAATSKEIETLLNQPFNRQDYSEEIGEVYFSNN